MFKWTLMEYNPTVAILDHKMSRVKFNKYKIITRKLTP